MGWPNRIRRNHVTAFCLGHRKLQGQGAAVQLLFKAWILLQAHGLRDRTRMREDKVAVAPVGGQSDSAPIRFGSFSSEHTPQSHQPNEAHTEPDET